MMASGPPAALLLACSEYLPRVSAVSLTVSSLGALPSTLSRLSRTRVYLKPSTSSIPPHTFELAAPVSPDTPVSLLQYASLNGSTLTLRLTADRREPETHEHAFPATVLAQCGGVRCKHCSNLLLPTDINFLDMPSESWFELMDYWHCHKPDHDHSHGASAVPSRDALKPKPESCLVGLSYLSICADTAMPYTAIDDSGLLFCSRCSASIGTRDRLDPLVIKIYKWSITLDAGSLPNTIPLHYDSEIFVAEILLDVVEFHSTYHFIISTNSDQGKKSVYVSNCRGCWDVVVYLTK
ncbi:ubiquitin-conjugating enzyme E2-binding protein [Limtongia smithiae]|uniref:ubiquitin-conjugating enzyme E2-binding protein n=1 Tax=Limtongia smithiae TaxID=1125753 RepID=UPI0034CD2B79